MPALAGWVRPVAIVTLLAMVALQWAGLKVSAWFQEWTTAVKFLAFLALIVAAFGFALPRFASYHSVWASLQAMTWPYALLIGVAAAASLASYWFGICAVLPSLRLREAAVVNLSSNAVANKSQASNNVPAKKGIYQTPTVLDAQLNSASLQLNGSSQPHSNLMPTLTLNWIIALQGVFPSRG